MTNKNKSKDKTFLSEILDLLKTVIVSFIIVSILTTWFIRPIKVEGNSMYPTIEDGALAVSGLINMNNGVERFDVVTVYQDYKEQYLIKRVIGMPNETVEMKNDILYIDGEMYNQDFLNQEYFESFDLFTGDFKIVLGEDEYFLMGDNRPNSSDSRVYGPFALEEITSEGVFVIYPFSEFGSVK